MEIVIIIILATLFGAFYLGYEPEYAVNAVGSCIGCLFLCLIFAILLGGCILIWQNIGK